MDRSLDEIVAERQRSNHRGGRRGGGPAPPRRGNNSYPRDGVRKPARDERANLDNDWVHDRYDDEDASKSGYSRPRGRRDDREERYETERERAPPPAAKLRVDNLHWDLTEDDIYELFSRIAPVTDVKMRYDRAGRSEGVAFVTYEHVADAKRAIGEFDGANAKGQPIRLQLVPLPARRDNPFDRVENPRSLFDRIEAPGGRDRRRSESPRSDVEEDRDRGYRRGTRRGPATAPREREREALRRSDVTKPAPENIDRYVPGQGGRGASRSSSHREATGRRPGERRERPRRDDNGQSLVGGRPRKTAEELDAEMEDYWGGNAAAGNDTNAEDAPAAAGAARVAEDDIDMIE